MENLTFISYGLQVPTSPRVTLFITSKALVMNFKSNILFTIIRIRIWGCPAGYPNF